MGGSPNVHRMLVRNTVVLPDRFSLDGSAPAQRPNLNPEQHLISMKQQDAPLLTKDRHVELLDFHIE